MIARHDRVGIRLGMTVHWRDGPRDGESDERSDARVIGRIVELGEAGLVVKRGWLFVRRRTIEWAQIESVSGDEVWATASAAPEPELSLVSDGSQPSQSSTVRGETARDEAGSARDDGHGARGEGVELRPVVRAVARLRPLPDGVSDEADEGGVGVDELARWRAEHPPVVPPS